MAETKIEKLNTSLEAASKEAGADAADTVPVVISAAAADRELSDEDLDKVSGGANSDGAVRPRSPRRRREPCSVRASIEAAVRGVAWRNRTRRPDPADAGPGVFLFRPACGR